MKQTTTAIYSYDHRVQADEVEQDGYVSCLTYLLWTRSAAMAHSAAQGWPPRRYLEIGAAWVVRSHWIEYLRPTTAGQEIIVRTWVANFRKTKALRKYQIIRPSDGAILVNAETHWALIDIEKHQPRRIPPELSAAFPIVSEDDEPKCAAKEPEGADDLLGKVVTNLASDKWQG